MEGQKENPDPRVDHGLIMTDEEIKEKAKMIADLLEEVKRKDAHPRNRFAKFLVKVATWISY